MSRPSDRGRGFPLRAGAVAALAFFLALGIAAAEGPKEKPGAEPRVAAGTSTAPAGTLLTRGAADESWRVAARDAEVFSGDALLALPLSRASVLSKGGAVQIEFLGNLPQLSPLPVLESAVTLHAAKAADLEFTLQRGRIAVMNRKEKGAAVVRLRLPDGAWELTLNDPRTEVALEKFGRWARGVPFLTDPMSGEAPTQDLVLLVLKGSVELKAGGRRFAMTAPPGAAYFHWDSVAGNDPGPRLRSDLPAWHSGDAVVTPEGKAALSVLDEVAKRYEKARKPEDVVRGLMADADKEADAVRAGAMRRGAVYGMAALDQLGGLTEALGHKAPDVRETAVVALRHWIGRGAGQDLKLYDFLQKSEKFSPAHAEAAVDLLHSYGDVDLRKPETYEVLIAYLRHPRPAVRELASWHLYRLVPAGKDIAYDPAGPAEGGEAAYKAWKNLVPTGQLPPERKRGDK